MCKGMLLLLLIFSSSYSFSQASKKFQFGSYNQFGVVKGESEASLTLQSVNGWRCKTWFVGAGIGLDEYYFSSLPLFLDVKKYLSTGTSSFYLYGDGGWNFSLEKNQKEMFNTVKNTGGLYYDIGVGYSKALHNNLHLLISAGYSGKNFERKVTGYNFYLRELQQQFVSKHDYEFSRLSFKVGLAF